MRQSIEILPDQVLQTDLYKLPEEAEIYIPLLPQAELSNSIKAVKRVKSVRMNAIPHLAARYMPSVVATDEWLAELSSMGVNSLMLVAGDGGCKGPYKDTLDLLGSGLLEKYGFINLGIAGHPDGHVHASDLDVRAALEIKKSYAIEHNVNMWVVTQFVFDMEHFSSWLTEWEEAFDFLPIVVGLAGRARLSALIKYAVRCGVVTSAKNMTRNHFFTVTPEIMLEDLRLYCDKMYKIDGLHLFPFGDMESAAEWMR